jgi:hypothetical protein
MVVAHHIPSMMLFGSQPLVPAMKAMRYASALLLIEASTPLLTRWRRSKRKDHFQQFMLVFFLVRVVYLSWLMSRFFEDIGGYVAGTAGSALTVVNIYWFCAQFHMLLNYREVGAADAPSRQKAS